LILSIGVLIDHDHPSAFGPEGIKADQAERPQWLHLRVKRLNERHPQLGQINHSEID
jgi:hypothetical protein